MQKHKNTLKGKMILFNCNIYLKINLLYKIIIIILTNQKYIFEWKLRLKLSQTLSQL